MTNYITDIPPRENMWVDACVIVTEVREHDKPSVACELSVRLWDDEQQQLKAGPDGWAVETEVTVWEKATPDALPVFEWFEEGWVYDMKNIVSSEYCGDIRLAVTSNSRLHKWEAERQRTI